MEPDKLKELAEGRFDHELHRKNLRERINGQLMIAHGGGLFKATPELITFLAIWEEDELVLVDSHNNPIMANRTELLNQLKQAYQFSMNAWLIEYHDSTKIRKGKDV